jgi:hypothetical protein
MRGKVAKAIRKSIYGENRKERHKKMRERDYRRHEKHQMIVTFGDRLMYQRAKKQFKVLGFREIVKQAQAAQVA